MATKKATLSAEEKAALKDRTTELKKAAAGTDGLADVQEKIADMPDEDRALAQAFHDLVLATAPDLQPRTWYGMPAYATPGKKGAVICFFQSASRMRTRYCTVGFSDSANLDDGDLWPTSFAVTAWNAAVDKRIRDLVSRAVAT